MSDANEAGPSLGHHWHILEAESGAGAGDASETLSTRFAEREIAEAHIELAEGIWHRPGAGAAALAHRLAATVIFSLIEDDSRLWRLSPLVRDIVTLGEEAVPSSLDALCAALEDMVEAPFRPLVEGLAGDIGVVERRFHEVVGLALTVARKISALP